MLLKEFALGASMLGREAQSAFGFQTRFLTQNVERNFKPIRNQIGAWKVLVDVVPTIATSKTKNLLGVLVSQVVGEPEKYLSLSRGEREHMALDWLRNGAKAAFRENGWPEETIENAIQAVTELKYENLRTWKSNLKNPSQTVKADIVVEMDDQAARIVVNFKTSENERERSVTLLTCLPDEFCYVPHLGKVAWLNDDTIQLTSRAGDESWVAARLPLSE